MIRKLWRLYHGIADVWLVLFLMLTIRNLISQWKEALEPDHDPHHSGDVGCG